MRRGIALFAVATVALTAGSASAVVPKRLPRCLVYGDPKGDSGAGVPAASGDPAMDLTKVGYAVTRDSLVGKLTVDALGDNPTKAWGDRFQLNFTFGEKLVEIYWKRSRTRDSEQQLFHQAGIRVDGTFVSESGVKGTYDRATNTMTLSVTTKALKAAVGKAVDGVVVGDVAALVYGSYVSNNVLWDRADAPGAGVFRITRCA